MAKLETLAADQTVVRPPEAVRRRASLQNYETAYRRSVEDNEGFWADAANELVWTKPWHTVREFDGVHHRWFLGGETNITLSALERNLDAGRADKTAYLWLGEDGDEKHLTYRELYAQVCRVANGLKILGVQKGDRVVIYLPLTLEGVTAMLACARIGAVHSVVYAGFAGRCAPDPHRGRWGEGRHCGRRELPAGKDDRSAQHHPAGGRTFSVCRARRRVPRRSVHLRRPPKPAFP